jgi:hypothetical protein
LRHANPRHAPNDFQKGSAMTHCRTRTIFSFFSIPVLLFCFSGSSHAQAVLQRKLAGSVPGNYSSANLSSCQPAAASDIRIKRFVPGMMQGYFRFDWTLFKNGQPYRSETQIYDLRGATALDYQNYTYVKDFFNLPTDAGVYEGKLEVRERGGPPWNHNYNHVVFSNVSPSLTLSDTTPTHLFTVRDTSGAFVVPPVDGSPIQVSLGGGITLDASGSSCETGYLVIVEEGNASWDRSGLHEMNKWFSGQAPANLNLQQTVTTYGQSDGTGYFSLIGGNIASGVLAGQTRYYRVGLQAAGAPWNPKMTLIQVNW